MRFVFSAVLLLTVLESIISQPQLQALASIIDDDNSTENARGSLWAVLVAGSHGYENYRHQADVLHAYHLLVSRGVPENQIITMMYDDIAYSKENPFPGQVFNVPDGPNVYDGVKIDYYGKDVHPQTLLDILTSSGESLLKNKKVLQSTKKDHIFIFFSDHGGKGTLCFPNDMLYADQLQEAFETMSRKKMFKKMVVYVEACEAGSMFENLPKQENVYVLTAASSVESSYACFWNDTLKTYMGDHFAVNWLLDTDIENPRVETLSEQYSVLRRLTTQSHVMNYGQMEITHDKVGEYQGMKHRKHHFNNKRTIGYAKDLLTKAQLVNQEDAHETSLMQQLTSAEGDQKQEITSKLEKVTKHKATVKELLQRIINSGNSNSEFLQRIEAQDNKPINFDCYRSLLEHFRKQCSHIIDFGTYDVIRHFYKFDNLCRHTISADFVKRAINGACETAE